MILVLLGTQNNDFSRLLKEIENCIDSKVIQEEVIVQAGFTKYETRKMRIFDMIPKEELKELVEKANIVISHGGIGSIQMALESGKKVIAVPRKSEFGEHVNNHQSQIVKNFNDNGYLIGIENVENLKNAIREIKNRNFKKYIKEKSRIIEVIEKFIKEKVK